MHGSEGMDDSGANGRANIVIVGVAGSSCSGKTTAITILGETLPLCHIPLDHFFRRDPADRLSGYDNWEICESLDFPRLADALCTLKEGRRAYIPSAPWTEDWQLAVEPASLIVVDGFILFADDVVNDILDLRIFIDLEVADQVRRRVIRNGPDQKEYVENVVVPCFKRYCPLLLSRADLVIDGKKPPVTIAKTMAAAIRDLLIDREEVQGPSTWRHT
jgi:uridine kinase